MFQILEPILKTLFYSSIPCAALLLIALHFLILSSDEKKSSLALIFKFISFIFILSCIPVASVIYYNVYKNHIKEEQYNSILLINQNFLLSEKEINSVNEAIKFKLISNEQFSLIKNFTSLDFNKNSLVITLNKADHEKCTTLLQDISKYTGRNSEVFVNAKSAEDVVRSTSNVEYECSLDKVIIKSIFLR